MTNETKYSTCKQIIKSAIDLLPEYKFETNTFMDSYYFEIKRYTLYIEIKTTGFPSYIRDFSFSVNHINFDTNGKSFRRTLKLDETVNQNDTVEKLKKKILEGVLFLQEKQKAFDEHEVILQKEIAEKKIQKDTLAIFIKNNMVNPKTLTINEYTDKIRIKNISIEKVLPEITRIDICDGVTSDQILSIMKILVPEEMK